MRRLYYAGNFSIDISIAQPGDTHRLVIPQDVGSQRGQPGFSAPTAGTTLFAKCACHFKVGCYNGVRVWVQGRKIRPVSGGVHVGEEAGRGACWASYWDAGGLTAGRSCEDAKPDTRGGTLPPIYDVSNNSETRAWRDKIVSIYFNASMQTNTPQALVSHITDVRVLPFPQHEMKPDGTMQNICRTSKHLCCKI